MKLKTLTAEFILAVMILPFVLWVVSSVYELRASYSDITEVKEDVKIIKKCLINGLCRE